jgi:hypothetical protein
VNRLLILTAAVLALACGGHSPTDPLEALNDIPRGTLNGLVIIGPNCPGPTTAEPCPTPPSAYASRKVEIWNTAHDKLLHTVDIDNGGFYVIQLPGGTYVADLKPNGIDRSADVPATVTIKENQTTRLDIHIDTGLR